MRHMKRTKKLGRTPAHRRAMIANMATSLFRSYAVVTTTPKARVVRSAAEKLITLGKRGDLHARRLAARQVNDRGVLKKLFEEIAPQFSTRPGGYTRIIKMGQRRGDGAELARLELVIPKAAPTASDDKGKGKAGKGRTRRTPAGAAKSQTGTQKTKKDDSAAGDEE
ncbi:MAG: 50S ribosomal protein L17 [Candidatus Zixiibacteriota bacterium]